MSEMLAYFGVFGISGVEERTHWVHMLHAMDRVYVEEVGQKIEQERAKRRAQGGRGHTAGSARKHGRKGR